MKRLTAFSLLAALLIACVIFPIAVAEDQPEGNMPIPFEKIQQVLVDGVNFLYSKQFGDGTWLFSGNMYPVGTTSLVLYALSLAGINSKDAKFQKGLAGLDKALASSSMDVLTTYELGLAIMAYEQIDRKKYEEQIVKLQNVLIERQAKSGGWDYTRPTYATVGKVSSQRTDWSNTQFGVLGLSHAERTEARGYVYQNRKPPEHWVRLRDYIVTTRTPEKGWPYCPTDANGMKYTSPTLTAAGIASSLLTYAALNHTSKYKCGSDTELLDIIDEGIGYYAATPDLVMQKVITAQKISYGLTYKMYAIERVGFYSGLRKIGSVDWFDQGAKLLIECSKDQAKGGWDEVVGAAFALMFLSKGRWPVVVQKLQWGDGWNDDALDMLRLTEKASEVFERVEQDKLFTSETVYMPTPRVGKNCTWATITLDTPFERWLDVPLLYFNGHVFPDLDGDAKKNMQKYAFSGGVILAVSGCGSKKFDEGLRQFCAEVFEGYPLMPVDRSHPLYASWYKAASAYAPLEAVIGPSGRPLLLYCADGVSCDWESGHIDSKETKLGVSIIKYVTDMVPGIWK